MNILFNKKNILTLAIFLIAVGLVIYFGLLPLAQKTASVYKQNKDKKAQLEINKQEVNDLEVIQKKINEDPLAINTVINYIPKTNETEFINQVESLASKGGNTFQSIKYLDDKKQIVTVPNATERKFEIIVKGTWPTVFNFINGLDKINQFNNTYNLSIINDDKGTTATITGAIFTRNQ